MRKKYKKMGKGNTLQNYFEYIFVAKRVVSRVLFMYRENSLLFSLSKTFCKTFH